MNRLKVWLFALAVVAAGAVTVRAHAVRLRAREIGQLDARLDAAAAQVGAATRTLAREASAAVAFAARDATLVEALHAKEAAPPPPPAARGKRARAPAAPAAADAEAQETALRAAAASALSSAEKTFGFDLPTGTVVTAGNREWLAARGEGSAADGEAIAFLRGAIGGKARRGLVRHDGALFHAAAAPAGDGAGLVVLVPADQSWLRTLAGAGVDATLSVPEVRPLSSAPGGAQALSPWPGSAGTAVAVGTLAKVDVAVGPLKLPALPPLLGPAPAQRARAVPLDGIENAFVVLSVAAAPALAPVLALEWQAALALALVLLAGLVTGLLVRAAEAATPVPEELLAAAVRIERGDFSARVPGLAGKLGTVAAALNRAAALAGPAAAAETVRPSVTDEFFARPLPKAEAPPAAAAAEEPLPAAGPFDAVPAPARPAPAPQPVAAAPELLQAAARTVSPATVEVDEEAHWQQVFQDFLRTRATCGEVSEGLTYEKFRVKLEGNRAALTAKYGCKSVRFQVYVKEGKAALKATPVK